MISQESTTKDVKLVGWSTISDVNKKNEACFKKKKNGFLLVFFGLKKNIFFCF